MAAFLPLVLLFGLMWVLVIRPQQQRVRAQQTLLASLQVGDEVITAGGVFGRIVRLEDAEADIEIAPGTVIHILRGAINRRTADDEPDFDGDDDTDGADGYAGADHDDEVAD
jgi:preprotein translocase subunit YajC